MEWIRMGEGDGIGVPSRECEFPTIDILNPALSILSDPTRKYFQFSNPRLIMNSEYYTQFLHKQAE